MPFGVAAALRHTTCMWAIVLAISTVTPSQGLAIQGTSDIKSRRLRGGTQSISPTSVARDGDEDEDGLLDVREDALMASFAPVLQFATGEAYLPTNVDSMLSLTTLWLYDDDCWPDLHEAIGTVDQNRISSFTHGTTCDSGQDITSGGTRSRKKQHTYYLKDLPDESDRHGLSDPARWATYVHSYRNDIRGITIQYWFLYAYNSLVIDHGGDWEGIHLVLDSLERPVAIRLLGHTTIESRPVNDFQWVAADDGEHPTIFVQRGGHTSSQAGSTLGVRHETWRTGHLVNVGEKRHPRNGQFFIQYSGLWGSPGKWYPTSGYWGPAYNETGLDTGTGFVAAWCMGMDDSQVEDSGIRECYPTAQSR